MGGVRVKKRIKYVVLKTKDFMESHNPPTNSDLVFLG